MSTEIADSLAAIERDWDIDPILHDFVLQKITDVSDYTVSAGGVTFHIPYLTGHQKYVLWKCLWPDCHNCCERQGRLPLTSDDLVTIGSGLKYSKTSDFVREETLTASWGELGGTMMTTVNLMRKKGETEKDDGTRIPCRFLDSEGGCSMHPLRPGVCHMYPFTTWLAMDGIRARPHASFQFTGDCPGFYLADDPAEMDSVIAEYSKIILDYNMASARTVREGLACMSL